MSSWNLITGLHFNSSKAPNPIDMDLEDEYYIRGKVIGISVHVETLIEDILANAVSDDQTTRYRVRAYFLRHLGFQAKLNLLRKIFESLGIKEAYKPLLKRVDDLTELRNVLAHQSSIVNQTDDKVGFYHLDQKSDNTMIITQAKTKDEWDKHFSGFEELVDDLISKTTEISAAIKKNRG